MSEDQKMMMESLHIRRSYASDDLLIGDIKFKTAHGTVELNLSQDDIRPILEHCAAAVVASSQRVAECLTADALAMTAIEHQPDE